MKMQDVVLPILSAFLLSALLGKLLIPLLKKVKVRQTVREDGPSTHLCKTGTPTMGGIIILLSILLSTLPFLHRFPEGIPVLCVTFGFGLIGFLDDFIKVVLRRSKGLSAFQKFLLQFLLTAGFWYYLYEVRGMDFLMQIPFSNGKILSLGTLSIPVFFFVVIGTVNGVNLTDGLDGLAASVTLMVAMLWLIISVFWHDGLFPVTGAAAGALLGFLLFNVHPASVFMGDTGSLALGGFVVSAAYMMQMPLFIVIVGLIYLVEVLSVIIQVTYFKKTGGKRIFRMAPIHHHFELGGWSETRVVAVFSITTAILCMIALLGLEEEEHGSDR